MLEADKFIVKEQVKFLKSSQSYEIFDADTQQLIGTAEEKIGGLNKMLRWVISKALMPTRFEIREKPDDALLFVIRRGAYIFRSRVEVLNADGELIGYFRSKILTIGGGFHVYDKNDNHFAEVKGNIIGFNYRILTPDKAVELGSVKKKWGGVGRELFTSADTYLVDIADDLKDQPVAKMLTLATALAIDMIFKSETRGGVGDWGGE